MVKKASVVNKALFLAIVAFTSLSNACNVTEICESKLPQRINKTRHSYNHQDKEIYKAFLTGCFGITAMVSLVGNGLVIHVVRTTPFMHTSVNMYIANMAVSDVISTLVCTPLMIKRLSQHYQWLNGTQGLILCRLVFFLFYTSFACSTFNHVAIAIDRYLAVTRPLFRYSRKMVKIIVVLIWVSSAMLSIPIIEGYKLHSYKKDVVSICYDSDRDTVYDLGVTIMALMCYVIPLTGATILYSLTGYHLRQRSGKSIGCYSDNRKRQASQSAYKAIKLMATVVTVFSLCWAPFFVYHLTKAWYDGKIYKALNWYYRPLSFLLASANAAINPFLYFVFNHNFRKGMTGVMCYFCRVKRMQKRVSLDRQISKVRSRTHTF